MKENSGFYDEISSFYDDMINYDELVLQREKALRSLFPGEHLTAADVGCGTGVDSIALSRLGHDVYSFDPSLGMLEKARANALRLGASNKFYNYPAGKIPEEFYGRFDLVLSLGNTFANIDTLNFPLALKNIYNLLNPGGRAVIQVLNFHKILNDKERIVNITRRNNFFFVRFYDFTPSNIIFNILTFDGDAPVNRSLTSTTLYPYTVEDFKSIFVAYDLAELNYYENFKLQGFDPETSKDLFIVIQKRQKQTNKF